MTQDDIIKIGLSLTPHIIDFFKRRGVDLKGVTAEDLQKLIEQRADIVLKDNEEWKKRNPA